MARLPLNSTASSFDALRDELIDGLPRRHAWKRGEHEQHSRPDDVLTSDGHRTSPPASYLRTLHSGRGVGLVIGVASAFKKQRVALLERSSTRAESG